MIYPLVPYPDIGQDIIIVQYDNGDVCVWQSDSSDKAQIVRDLMGMERWISHKIIRIDYARITSNQVFPQ